MSRKWTDEQRKAASERMKQINEMKKAQETTERKRVPVGAKRDIINVHDTPKDYVDRWVNDENGRIERLKAAGYEFVEKADVGSSHVDGTHNESGVVSKDMGKGVTAYLMRQRQDYYREDQAEKQRIVDRTEESMRKAKVKPNESTDGTYGEIKIGQN